MNDVDRREKLAEFPFSYRISKDNKVLIYWRGKQVLVMKGNESAKFLARISNADEHSAQLLMAKATGNFKRGNEKLRREPNQ